MDTPSDKLTKRVLDRLVKENLLSVSGLTEDDARRRPNRLVMPEALRATPQELVDKYLAGTPLHALLMTPVSWPLACWSSRFSGVWGRSCFC